MSLEAFSGDKHRQVRQAQAAGDQEALKRMGAAGGKAAAESRKKAAKAEAGEAAFDADIAEEMAARQAKELEQFGPAPEEETEH